MIYWQISLIAVNCGWSWKCDFGLLPNLILYNRARRLCSMRYAKLGDLDRNQPRRRQRLCIMHFIHYELSISTVIIHSFINSHWKPIYGTYSDCTIARCCTLYSSSATIQACQQTNQHAIQWIIYEYDDLCYVLLLSYFSVRFWIFTSPSHVKLPPDPLQNSAYFLKNLNDIQVSIQAYSLTPSHRSQNIRPSMHAARRPRAPFLSWVHQLHCMLCKSLIPSRLLPFMLLLRGFLYRLSMRTPTTLRFHRPSSRYARASNTGPYSSTAEYDELHPKMSKFITISSLEANNPLPRTYDPWSYHVRHRGLVVARRDKSLGHCTDCGTEDGAGARLVAQEECPDKWLVRAQRVKIFLYCLEPPTINMVGHSLRPW